MRARWSNSLVAGLILLFIPLNKTANAASPSNGPMPRVADDWSITLIAKAPQILFPTAIVSAPDGTIYLGQDPMDMPGPPTVPIDSVVAIKNGQIRVFADKLWAVMGLEWADDTLFVVHAPFLSAFRDTDGDGKADQRVDLMTGLGPKLPGFSGINDHVASGVRLGIDGYLYISVGDKGIPRGVGKDGATIELFGGGVIRIRPDGTGLEVVSTGERNPLSVALSTTDEIFTYGNDDDSKKWPNSLTHHIVGAHFGYPYQFLTSPFRTLPIMAGQLGGSGTQGICYNEDGLAPSYRGNLFFCDWGLQSVFRYTIAREGGTFKVKSKTPFVTKGELGDFRPFSLGVSSDGASLLLVDWAFNSWLANGPKTGRLYQLSYKGSDKPKPALRPSQDDIATQVAALDHPAHSVRLASQRSLAHRGPQVTEAVVARLRKSDPETGTLHALWTLDLIGTRETRAAIREAITSSSPELRSQAARSAGQRRDREALPAIGSLLNDKNALVRREAAIALGKIGDPSAAPMLLAALGDSDTFSSWSIRNALRTLAAWDKESLTKALLDPKRREDALKVCDESWATPVIEALTQAFAKTPEAEVRARIVSALAGLYRRYPKWSGNWFGTNPLAGQFPQKTQPWDASAMAKVQAGLEAAAKDANADVRLQAIAGLIVVGRPALATIRSVLTTENDPRNLAAVAQGLGVLADFASASALGKIVIDETKPISVRTASLDALGNLRGPQALTARISLVYDPKAPASLVARALPSLGLEGIIPPNDLAGFLENTDPTIRAAALRALSTKKGIPDEVGQAVLSRIEDQNPEVRKAACVAVATLQLHEAIPKLLQAALKPELRNDSMVALAAMPDPRALPVYLGAIRDRSPEVRGAGETALLAIRDSVRTDLEKAARSGKYEGPAGLVLERVLTRFTPVKDWKIIGPFARTTAQVFIGERSIDFALKHSGAEGHTIAWQSRKGDAASGRVVINDFKGGAGDRGGFGYDTNGSPDMCGFGYAEINSASEREALMLVGSSGSILVTLNEEPVHSYRNFAGRSYSPDSDLVVVPLKKGLNRLLVQSRQGIGTWSFGIQISEPASLLVARKTKAVSPETMRAFAMSREGDPRAGETIFFDTKGIGCVKCHAAAGRGSGNIGPDLTGLALKYDKAEIIRSVLEPSNRIATGYQPALIATSDGKVITGVVRQETDAFVELADSEAKIIRVPKSVIEERKIGEVSVMPTGIVESLSPVEFVDLISYLQSLKSAPLVNSPR